MIPYLCILYRILFWNESGAESDDVLSFNIRLLIRFSLIRFLIENPGFSNIVVPMMANIYNLS